MSNYILSHINDALYEKISKTVLLGGGLEGATYTQTVPLSVSNLSKGCSDLREMHLCSSSPWPGQGPVSK